MNHFKHFCVVLIFGLACGGLTDARAASSQAVALRAADQQKRDYAVAEHGKVRARLSSEDRAILARLTASVRRALKNAAHADSLATAANVVKHAAPGLSARESGILARYVLDDIASNQNGPDSDNEISEMGSMQQQMLMDTRSKLLQTVSDIEKAQSETDQTVTESIKQ